MMITEQGIGKHVEGYGCDLFQVTFPVLASTK
jgi:hypothetical protein